MIRKLPASLAAAFLLILLQSRAASAHLVSTGLGPVYDGIYHFFLSPEEVLAVIALSLYAGLKGSRPARLVFFALPFAWLIGTQLGLAPPGQTQTVLVAVSFLILGSLLAASFALPAPIIGAIAVVLGLWHGSNDGISAGSGAIGLLPVIGGFVSIGVLSAIVASLSLPLKQLWTIILVRVAGSWVAALGLLLVGWSVHAAHLDAH